jgi:CheY-like chemotaxis protein
MDHMMPIMDGFEAVQIIRSEINSDYAKTVPIIALTANAILGNEDLFLKNGFQAFLSKPIDIMRLDIIINRYVRDKKLEQELSLTGINRLSAPESQGEKKGTHTNLLAGKSLDGIDFSEGLRRFENDEEMYLGIVSAYFSQIPTLLKRIQFYTAETLGDYRITVHSLKSTSYTVGAKHIGSMAAELEKAADSGNIEFVKSRNPALVEAMEKLQSVLGDFMEEIKSANQKPMREAPDTTVLARLLDSCLNYDMEQMDVAIDELEQYRYESQADLVEWLRKEMNKSEFEIIREGLEKLNLKAGGVENG